MRTLFLTMLPVGFCLGAAEVGFPAFGESVGDRALAGPLIAIWSLGSAAGGLLGTAHTATGSRCGRRIGSAWTVIPLVTLPLALPDTMAAMAPLALLAGVAIAPLIAVVGQLVGEVAPQGALTEAYTWPRTALVGGVAAGNAAAGAT